MSKPSKPEIVISVQYFDGGSMPVNIIRRHNLEAGTPIRKAVEFSTARLLEELIAEKPPEHRHD